MTTPYRARTYKKDLQARPALKRRQVDRSRIEELGMLKALGLDPKVAL